MENKIYAIITGDIIKSSNMIPGNLIKLMEDLPGFGRRLQLMYTGMRMETYRGDSFQILLDTPEDALYIAILF
jgi:hypothetical protein